MSHEKMKYDGLQIWWRTVDLLKNKKKQKNINAIKPIKLLLLQGNLVLDHPVVPGQHTLFQNLLPY